MAETIPATLATAEIRGRARSMDLRAKLLIDSTLLLETPTVDDLKNIPTIDVGNLVSPVFVIHRANPKIFKYIVQHGYCEDNERDELKELSLLSRLRKMNAEVEGERVFRMVSTSKRGNVIARTFVLLTKKEEKDIRDFILKFNREQASFALGD